MQLKTSDICMYLNRFVIVIFYYSTNCFCFNYCNVILSVQSFNINTLTNTTLL